jgi:hypothetical protein
MSKKKTLIVCFEQWISPLLMILVCLGCSGRKQEESKPVVSFHQEPGELLIMIGDQPFATYVYEDTATTRPYFAHVKTPCGIQATRNHPPEADDPQDHSTYHPGIWLSFGDINGNDYWRIKAKVEHEMFVKQPEGGPGKGTFAVRNYYMSSDGKHRVLAQVVNYTILVRPAGYLLLTNSTFSSDAGDFTFGDQEEMGLGIRVNTKITRQYGQGHITNAEGLTDGKETWGKASKWIDYSGRIGDSYVGMAIMPDLKNFRPSWYHARDYGFIAANPFGREAMKQGEKSVVEVKKGQTFDLGFGILIYCNPAGEKIDIDSAYQDYINITRTEEVAITKN